jgi:hypothetical protein
VAGLEDVSFDLGDDGEDWRLDIDFDLADFDLDARTDGLESDRYVRPKAYEGTLKREVAYEHAMDFARDIEFRDGMRVFAFVSGNFIFGDLIEALVDLRKISIKTITVQTLSVSEENIDSFKNVMDMCPFLERFDLILSAYFWSYNQGKQGGLVPYLYETLDENDVFQVAFAGVHTKIVTIETVRGHKLVMHGSANMRSSRNVEHIVLEDDPELFDYIEEFAGRIIEAYGTIDKRHKKPLRGGQTIDDEIDELGLGW